MSLPSFVHLDARSYFSLKDGACSPEQLAYGAAELGMPAVAMTDRDGRAGLEQGDGLVDAGAVRSPHDPSVPSPMRFLCAPAWRFGGTRSAS